MGILSRFQCRDVPTPCNLRSLCIQLAKFEFQVKPMTAVIPIHSGIPKQHVQFWECLSLPKLYGIYQMLTANASKVVAQLEPDLTIPEDERIFSYLENFVGNMNRNMLRKFLRFCTGTSTCIGNVIKVRFNNLTGLARRPTCHTCEPSQELPISYSTYDDFVNEFELVLSDPKFSWEMDTI